MSQVIDSLSDVRFLLRTVLKHWESFWLPTATDKFYSDFVAQLNDERLRVVKCKGALLAGSGMDDANEKREIGAPLGDRERRQRLVRCGGKAGGDRDMRRQLQDKIAA